MMARSTLLIGLVATTAACGTSPGPAGSGDASSSGAQSSAENENDASTGTASSADEATSESSDPNVGLTTPGNVDDATGQADTTTTGTASTSTVTSSTSTSTGDSGTVVDVTDTVGQDDTETDGTTSTETGVSANCVGNAWPTADPTIAGPFQVAADKNVGPLAGVVPDPIYGDQQQRFNVYRPSDLENSGYCHPILIWANGYRDNPEQNPPECVVDSNSNQWCGQYLPMVNHLASHGFVVVAPLSTATGNGDPLPTTVGLDWILEQADDPSSPYYQRLDTANVGQLGHSFGGMSTCSSASDPRYRALGTICGTGPLEGVHTPMLFFCGERDDVVTCSGVRDTFLSVTDQPAFFLNELDSDHGSWVYEGPGGVSLSSAAAWFRVHLMGDTENRRFFYGPDCTFCSDSRVQVEQNSLMVQ